MKVRISLVNRYTYSLTHYSLTHSLTHLLTHSQHSTLQSQEEFIGQVQNNLSDQQLKLKVLELQSEEYNAGMMKMMRKYRNKGTYSLTHALTYLLTYSLTYSLTHALTYSLIGTSLSVSSSDSTPSNSPYSSQRNSPTNKLATEISPVQPAIDSYKPLDQTELNELYYECGRLIQESRSER